MTYNSINIASDLMFWNSSQGTLEIRRRTYLKIKKRGSAFTILVIGLLGYGTFIYLWSPIWDIVILRDLTKAKAELGLGSAVGSIVVGLIAGCLLEFECDRFLRSDKGLLPELGTTAKN